MVAVVTPPRLQEKVMVALTAARAARVQALEVRCCDVMELGHWTTVWRVAGAGANSLPHSHICHTNTQPQSSRHWTLWPA